MTPSIASKAASFDIIIAVLLTCICTTSDAQSTSSWISTSNTDWSEPANWSYGVPSASLDTIIDNGHGPVLGEGSGTMKNLYVGDSGMGTLAIEGDGVISNAVGYIGSKAGSTGIVIVGGTGTWKNSSTLFVGDKGVGVLSIRESGTVSDTFGYIGNDVGSSGTLMVGGSAVWKNTNSIFVGNSGTGVLILNENANVTNAYCNIGYTSGAHGYAKVSGSGIWENTRFYVGRSGIGMLAIEANGRVTVTQGFVGNDAGSQGTVTLSGSGVLKNTESLVVGYGGSGTFHLNGGMLQAPFITLARNNGATGVIEIGGDGSGIITALDGSSPIVITGSRISASVIFSHTGATTVFSNTLAGTMIVRHTGAGTTALTAVNTYTGTTILDAGVLQVTTSSNLGKSPLAGSGVLAIDAAGSSFAFSATQAAGNFNGTVRLQNSTTFALHSLDDTTRGLLLRSTLQLSNGGVATTNANSTIGNLDFAGGMLWIQTDANAVPSETLTVNSLSITDGGTVCLSGWEAPSSSGGSSPSGMNFIDESSMVDAESILLIAASSVGNVSQLTLQDKDGNPVSTNEQRINHGNVEAVYGSIVLNGSNEFGETGLFLSIGKKLTELAIANGSTFDLSTNDLDDQSTHVLAAKVTGTGNLRVTGTDYVIFSGFNTYSGQTIVSEHARLVGGRQDAIVNSSELVIEANAAFETGDFSQRVKGLRGDGVVKIANGKTFTVGIAASGSSSFAGSFTGEGNFEKCGEGVQTLGAMSITGTTIISEGTLEMSGRISGPVANNSRLIATDIEGVLSMSNASYAEVQNALGGVSNSGTLNVFTIGGTADNLAGGVIRPRQSGNVFQNLRNNGVVSLTDIAIGGTIAIAGNLEGNGAFEMIVNLDTGDAQKLKVVGDVDGNHELRLTNSGTGIVGNPESLRIRLVEIDGQNRGVFSGTTSDGMNLFTVQQKDHEAYLASPGMSAAGSAILSTAGVVGMDWHYGLDNLRNRMGELRGMADSDSNKGPTGNQWIRGNAYRLDANQGLSGAGFSQNTYGLAAGVDRAFISEKSTVYLGAFVAIGRSDREYDHNGDGNTDDYGAGLYGTWMHQSGFYADFVARADRYENDLNAREVDGKVIHASYNSEAWGLSLEAGWRLDLGRRIWVEPSVQMAMAWLSGESYGTDSGIFVQIENAAAAQYRAQLRVGADWGRWRPFVKIAEVKSDTDGGLLHADGQVYNPQFDGWRFEAGAGLCFIINSKNLLYFDYEYNRANYYKRPWAVNFGYRRMW